MSRSGVDAVEPLEHHVIPLAHVASMPVEELLPPSCLRGGPGWAERPTLGPAMAVGLGSTAAPWPVMQPAFGLGVAAAKSPPARLRSLRTHATSVSGCTSPVGRSRPREPVAGASDGFRAPPVSLPAEAANPHSRSRFRVCVSR
jgi:Protein of unknown function (DUF2938)